MSRPEDEIDAGALDRLLAGAAKVIAKTPFCWLMTAGDSAGVSTRPMGRLLHDPGKDEWTIPFVTDGRSHKASELRRDGEVGMFLQRDGDEAWLALHGKATLHEGPSEVGRRWKPAYDAFFPTEADRAHAMFVDVEVDRMDLWIRGVTPEPFGLRATTLERRPGGEWRLIPADSGVG